MSAVRAARPFLALLSAAQGIEQADPERLRLALDSVPAGSLRRVAARHRCLGYIYRGILENRLRTPPAQAFSETLREHRAKAAMQAFATRKQLDDVMVTLETANIPFVLLKGAARLFRNDIEADWNLMCDIDILVPEGAASTARAAMQAAGYRSRPTAPHAPAHHHLPPLEPPHVGLSVEIHTGLAPPHTMSTNTGWRFCEPYMERAVVGERAATCFNPTGTAIHLMIHGVGVKRLHDAIMLARLLRGQPELHARLESVADAEEKNGIPLRALLRLSSGIAGLEVPRSAHVDSYLGWVMRREHLGPYVRGRCQFVDAWYGNGQRVWGPTTRAALPPYHEPGVSALAQPVLYASRLLGRVVMSAYAAVAAPVTHGFLS